MNLLNKMKSGINKLKYTKAGLIARDKAPEIFLGIGIVTFASTVYLACKATTKLENVIDEHQEELDIMNALAEDLNASLDESSPITKEEEDEILDQLVEVKHDKRALYRHTIWKVTKLYGPSAVTAVISVTSLIGGNRILRNRYNNAVIAGNAILSAFNLYRERVIEELGEAADLKFRYGGTTEKIEVVDENGEKQTVNSNKFKAPNFDFDTIIFSPETSDAYDENMLFNLSLIKGQVAYVNETYKKRKERHLVLNELLDMLSIKENSFGMTYGWHQDAHDNEETFKISVGLDDQEHKEYERMLLDNWRKGIKDQPILLTLNLDGDITPYLRKNEKLDKLVCKNKK